MNTECAICLIDDIIQCNKCTTQCNHDFCKHCLDAWFDKGKHTCPMCRQSIKYFTCNGLSHRIISVEKKQDIRPPTPVTRSVYSSIRYLVMVSMAVNALSFYIMLNGCDI